jgi:hypothetical protein
MPMMVCTAVACFVSRHGNFLLTAQIVEHLAIGVTIAEQLEK